MVACERCHRKFTSYAALLQHHKDRHPNVTNLSKLEGQVTAEKETELITEASIRSHGPSRVKLVAFFIIVIIAVSVIGYVAITPKEQTTKKVTVGMAAPDFTLPAVGGGTFALSTYRSQANVLLFFNEGLSCQPCLQQMADLDQLNSKFAELNIVAVSITGDPLNVLTNWASSGGPRFSKVLSDQSLTVSKAYDLLGPDVSMMPGIASGHTFVLIDKLGIIKWRQDYGPNTMYVPNDQIIAAVRRALGT